MTPRPRRKAEQVATPARPARPASRRRTEASPAGSARGSPADESSIGRCDGCTRGRSTGRRARHTAAPYASDPEVAVRLRQSRAPKRADHGEDPSQTEEQGPHLLRDRPWQHPGEHHATTPCGWSVATKISSSVSDSVVSVSGERAFKRSITSAALPLTTTSMSRGLRRRTRAPARSSAAGLAGEARVDLLVALARRVGGQRQHVAAPLDDRELVDQPFELGDEVRGDEDRPPARVAVLVGADDRLDELAADDRIEAGGRLVEHQQLGLGTDGGDQRELRPLPFREVARLLAGDRAGTGRAARARCRGSSARGTRRSSRACRARSSTGRTRRCRARRRAAT